MESKEVSKGGEIEERERKVGRKRKKEKVGKD